MSILDTIKKGASLYSKALGTEYDYLTPGKGSSRLTDFGSGGNNARAVTPINTPSYAPSSIKVDTSGYDKQIADSNNAIKALQAQLASQPKLPFYDTSAAWARAQAGAENAVNPVYLDKLNQYLEKARLQRSQTEEQTNLNKGNIATGLGETIQDIGTQRTRTAEDTQTNLADLAASESFDQEQGGTQFDRARQALLGDIAQSGLTTSGLGQQREQQAISDRNVAETEQGRQYEKQRTAVKTLKDRTFADLTTSESRAKSSAEGKTKQEDINLKNFIDNQGVEEKSFRTGNEADRLAAVAGEVNNQYNVGTADFIRGLIGSGARAQDIALAQQVYA